MDKFQQILGKCKKGVYLTVNDHRCLYLTATQALEDMNLHGSPPDIPDEIRDKMIELDTIIELQFYPETAVGFFLLYHYDLDAILDNALECLKEISRGDAENAEE